MNRNATAHFETLKALEEAVYHSACDIELYSQFRKELPDQCLVIERFEAFKKAFPCFHLEGKDLLSFDIDFVDGLYLSSIDLQFLGAHVWFHSSRCPTLFSDQFCSSPFCRAGLI
jgi:hypothetical protein